MNILIPRLSVPAMLNRFWAMVKQHPIAQYVSHAAQAPLAFDLSRLRSPMAARFAARGLFDRPCYGAGYAWESRRWLQPQTDGAIATTGANSVIFNVMDYVEVHMIGFVWTVAGTVTAMVMQFDKYAAPGGLSTQTAKLDTVNGVITAPSVASQAIANVLYKDLSGGLTGSPGVDAIALQFGNSINANVTTTTTAGNGIPFVIVTNRAETMLNLSTAQRSS